MKLPALALPLTIRRYVGRPLGPRAPSLPLPSVHRPLFSISSSFAIFSNPPSYPHPSLSAHTRLYCTNPSSLCLIPATGLLYRCARLQRMYPCYPRQPISSPTVPFTLSCDKETQASRVPISSVLGLRQSILQPPLCSPIDSTSVRTQNAIDLFPDHFILVPRA
jgi:hypothetical protein